MNVHTQISSNLMSYRSTEWTCPDLIVGCLVSFVRFCHIEGLDNLKQTCKKLYHVITIDNVFLCEREIDHIMRSFPLTPANIKLVQDRYLSEAILMKVKLFSSKSIYDYAQKILNAGIIPGFSNMEPVWGYYCAGGNDVDVVLLGQYDSNSIKLSSVFGIYGFHFAKLNPEFKKPELVAILDYCRALLQFKNDFLVLNNQTKANLLNQFSIQDISRFCIRNNISDADIQNYHIAIRKINMKLKLDSLINVKENQVHTVEFFRILYIYCVLIFVNILLLNCFFVC